MLFTCLFDGGRIIDQQIYTERGRVLERPAGPCSLLCFAVALVVDHTVEPQGCGSSAA
jgi:hypothetical protein